MDKFVIKLDKIKKVVKVDNVEENSKMKKLIMKKLADIRMPFGKFKNWKLYVIVGFTDGLEYMYWCYNQGYLDRYKNIIFYLDNHSRFKYLKSLRN
jgi:uncharacterized protein (DUF3820 family)